MTQRMAPVPYESTARSAVSDAGAVVGPPLAPGFSERVFSDDFSPEVVPLLRTGPFAGLRRALGLFLITVAPALNAGLLLCLFSGRFEWTPLFQSLLGQVHAAAVGLWSWLPFAVTGRGALFLTLFAVLMLPLSLHLSMSGSLAARERRWTDAAGYALYLAVATFVGIGVAVNAAVIVENFWFMWLVAFFIGVSLILVALEDGPLFDRYLAQLCLTILLFTAGMGVGVPAGLFR